MTADRLERKLSVMERHVHLVRTLPQAIAFAKTVDRALAAIDRSVGIERPRRHEMYNTIIRVATVQAAMWRARDAGMEN